MLNQLEKLTERAAKASFYVASLAIVLMMFHISGDVIARTVFGTGLPGTLEITAEWYMIAVVYMPLALIQLRDENITVDLFSQMFSDRVQHVLRVLMSFLALVFIYNWAQASLELAQKKTKRMSFLDSGLWQIPTWPVYWACFIAIALLFCATVVVMLMAVRDARRNAPVAHDESDEMV